MSIAGVDTSSVQGKVNWDIVRKAGYEFTINKATESVGVVDSWFARNTEMAKAAGLRVGAYHFFSTRPDRSIKDQLDLFNKIALGKTDLDPTMDLEFPSPEKMQDFNVDPATICDKGLEFAEGIKSTWGVYPYCYTYMYFWNFLPDNLAKKELATKCPLWMAWYNPVLKIPKEWTKASIWQKSGNGGKVPGVFGDCDINVMLDPFQPSTAASVSYKLKTVIGIQRALNKLGFPCGQEDDRMGPKTWHAITDFQTKYNLKVDGIVGIATRTVMKKALATIGILATD